MIKKIVKSGIIFWVAVFVTFFSIATENQMERDDLFKGKPIEKVACSSSFNKEDLESIYGFSDYVTVVKINKEEAIHYENVTNMGAGEKFGIPYTDYSITVKENLKGSLPDDAPIIVTKAGGLSKDKKTYYVDEGDILLEEGECYIMAFCVQEDGSLLASGVGSAKSIKYGYPWYNDVEKYRKICENSANIHRKRYQYKTRQV